MIATKLANGVTLRRPALNELYPKEPYSKINTNTGPATRRFVNSSGSGNDKSESKNVGVTEIILANSGSQLVDHSLVLPMLVQLSHKCDDRWFTWVSPQSLEKKEGQKYGFSSTNTRVLRSSSRELTLCLLWDALYSGTSAYVCAEIDTLSEQERANIEFASQEGRCMAIILENRSK